ncbi:MAG: hypothetical protein KF726_03695 [Anaerolineae bacterium]|nr:hypothetical protein [Anaerolineae bacterium]
MIETPTAVTILYTAALHGDLALLPRLFTLIKRERASAEINLLVDLGRSCATGSWICESTNGRGMLVAMDALGYDAFHIGTLDILYAYPALVQQIQQVITTPLAAGPWSATATRRGLTFSIVNAAAPRKQSDPADLIVALRLSKQSVIEASAENGQRLLLLDGGLPDDPPLVGRIDLLLLPDAPYLEITSHARLKLSPDLLPDPTVSGVIEFVESEARWAEKKRNT